MVKLGSVQEAVGADQRRRPGRLDLGKVPSPSDARALRLIRAANKAALEAEEELQFLTRICRVLTDLGGYALVAVSHADDNPEGSMSPVAISGSPLDYMIKAANSWAPGERGGEPTGAASRTGKTVINRNFAINPNVAPWRAAAKTAGFRSSIAIPLRLAGVAHPSVLSIYSTQLGLFDRQEAALLEELAATTAFCVDVLRLRIAEQAAREQSRRQTEVISAVEDMAPDGFMLVGPNDEILSCNQHYLDLWKIHRSQIEVESVAELEAFLASRCLDPEAFRSRAVTAFAGRLRQAVDHDVFTLKDGRILDRYTAPAVLKGGEYVGRIVVLRDITGARKLELRLKRINRILLFLAGVLALVCLVYVLRATIGRTNVFAADGKSPLREENGGVAPYSAIALVEPANPVQVNAAGRRSGVSGTGFMVSPCYALTDYHVVFGSGGKTPDTQASRAVWISLGRTATGFAYNRLPAAVVRWSDFPGNPLRDWALLQVPGCPGRDAKIGWIALASGKAFNPYRGAALVAGYNALYPGNMLVGQTDCYLGRIVPPMLIRHYCASQPGMSGGPIIIKGPDGPLAVAMLSRETAATRSVLITNDPAHANLATYIPQVFATSDIGGLINTDLGLESAGKVKVAAQ